MGQLTPLEHIGPDSSEDCPACVVVNEVFNEMSVALEKASMQVACDDVAFVLALLVQHCADAAPTAQAREFFLLTFAQQLDIMLTTDARPARHPTVMPMPSTPQ